MTLAPQGLHCLRIANDALKGDTLPARLKVLAWGANELANGQTVIVNATTLSALPGLNAKYGLDRIALDFNHNSVKGHPNYKPDPRAIAAYGVPEIVEGDGLYLSSIEYTPAGKEYAANYRDLSPAPKLNDRGEVILLHSVALCEHGQVKGLEFYSADYPLTTPEPSAMNHKDILIKLLGLSPEATDADIQSAADKALKEVEVETLNADTPDNITALSTRLDDIERGQILASAAAAGKAVPASARTFPLAQLKALVADLPEGVVPLSAKTPEVTPLTATEPSGLSVEIARNLGIAAESLK
jgi:phage I-like protein